ncbi:MAG: hypothetical protein K8R48_02620 [Alphaproteobacteria bacterium]|nr:hypothetical protein [Alphaproteobacteria bacterium]
MKYSNIAYKLAAALTTGALLSESTTAFATGGFKGVTQNIVTSSSLLPNLISTVAYIGGVGLGVAGVFKLKQHVDNPGQTPMKDGLVRLGAGGGLLALPMVTKAMQGTVATSASKVNASELKFDAATFAS